MNKNHPQISAKPVEVIMAAAGSKAPCDKIVGAHQTTRIGV
jgi:uncharacterized protein YneF (UPF0154 family)